MPFKFRHFSLHDIFYSTPYWVFFWGGGALHLLLLVVEIVVVLSCSNFFDEALSPLIFHHFFYDPSRLKLVKGQIGNMHIVIYCCMNLMSRDKIIL